MKELGAELVDGRATITDVALRAGVSEATVSRALRGLPHVATATRDRVAAAAAELDYVASPSAARLASGRTMTVALAAPYLDRWYAGRLLAGVESALWEEGLDLLVTPVTSRDGRLGFLERLPALGRKVDGMILIDWFVDPSEVDDLAAAGPVVTIGERHHQFSSVTIDNEAASRAATEHLIGLGHSRFALLIGDEDLSACSPVRPDRRQGFRAALAEAGLDPDHPFEVDGGFTVAGGVAAAEALFEAVAEGAIEAPTALVVQSDEMAMGAMLVARRRGVRIPEDLAVIGFDGHDAAEPLELSTIVQPLHEMGSDAVHLLASAVAGGEPRHHIHECPLVARRSTLGG